MILKLMLSIAFLHGTAEWRMFSKISKQGKVKMSLDFIVEKYYRKFMTSKMKLCCE